MFHMCVSCVFNAGGHVTAGEASTTMISNVDIPLFVLRYFTRLNNVIPLLNKAYKEMFKKALQAFVKGFK